ncbi:MAG: recombinase family protein [Planctomycetota bacterium]|jgi:DNA invertase Pin-like site-specific DNA recombinase
MTLICDQKVTPSHLKRNAYLYVRQSTVRQVLENTESTQRQYALRQRAVALGWPTEQVVVIDQDLGRSGASVADREGFQYLAAEVGMGRAGLVLGLEVSRLARNNSDWHRLLEICALTDTLILDEDGLYDPGHFNDRLILGMKGVMSEAELHVLQARLWGGILSKAERGELRSPLPVGLVYNSRGRVTFDPDKQVQESVRLFFRTFRRTGAASATVKAFCRQGLKFPLRLRRGPHKGELVWRELSLSRALQILHNPRYAGAFFYGRTRGRKTVDGKTIWERLPPDQWHALRRDTHEGYISWEEYQDNERRLRETAQARGTDRRRSPPREGPALLQGLAMCGVCGQRMTVRYHRRLERIVPDYVCQRYGIEHGRPICQRIPGADIDEAIGKLLVEAVTPMALEVALTVQQELQSRLDETDRLRQQQVERARYEVELAKRRYMQVDPDNRLVADALEADWNAKLRALTEAQEEYERQRVADQRVLDEKQHAQIMALATDFPRLWRDAHTPQRERKRMVRLLLEDVTLIRGQQITIHARFKGGTARTLTLPLPRTSWELRLTPPETLAEIDRLLDDYTDAQIAQILNERGFRSGCGQTFCSRIVARLRREHTLKSRHDRLREAGMLTLDEMATLLGVCTRTVHKWRKNGLLRAHTCNDKNECLYEPPWRRSPNQKPRLQTLRATAIP